ncbi:major facilitator superfamily domain-containing protein [Cytidiella melzeri]|nr:major facilitator superfamily domain-containing protein [Cytidiella melzeri]
MAHKCDKLTFWQKLTTVRINPANNKCLTLPIFSLNNHYSINFHLSWLGFWVAFLSWFAFSPLVPEAVRTDLKLTQKQIGNSNIISLCATLVVRVLVGPLVDKFGPRKVMAALLILGAIPSGLAGTVSSVQGFYVIRFFIGILGGTFVPCQAWTTLFFDTTVVGRANALVGGWGNSGGGFTFVIMVALYNRLREDGMSAHSAWRVAFAIVPVPILITVAIATLIFGTDHPNGKWADRNKTTPARPLRDTTQVFEESDVAFDNAQGVEKVDEQGKASNQSPVAYKGGKAVSVEVQAIKHDVGVPSLFAPDSIDPTWSVLYNVLVSPVTWLPALAYLTSFGYELAIDANLSNVLFGLYNPTRHAFDQTTSGYIASIYGLLNVFSRPMGGYLGDLVYRKYGVSGKKYLVLLAGVIQGLLSVGFGLYTDHHHSLSPSTTPSLTVIIVLMILLGLVNEMANGANFSLVPHCNPSSNGLMTGTVGSMGNFGGICFALVWRYQPLPYGKAFWIAGIVTVVRSVALLHTPRWFYDQYVLQVLNAALVVIRV